MSSKLRTILIAIAIFWVPFITHAATLRFDVPTSTVSAGSTFAVRAVIDSDVPVNAYDLTLSFAGPVSLQKINTANSVVSFWQENPAASGGIIPLRGGSFDAFKGTDGNIVTLYFKATGSGPASFTFENSSVYAADGKGTKIVPGIKNAEIGIGSATTGSSVPGDIGSDEPATVPQIASLDIVRDASGQKLLSFLATDAGSGVMETDVRFRTIFAWSPWQSVVNPTTLPSDAWEIDFRAINNDGVGAERMIYDWKSIITLAAEAAAVAIFFLAGVVIAIRYRKTRKL